MPKLSPTAKLTHEIAAEIRRRIAAGERANALAIEFGVHESAISRIRNGKAYRDEIQVQSDEPQEVSING